MIVHSMSVHKICDDCFQVFFFRKWKDVVGTTGSFTHSRVIYTQPGHLHALTTFLSFGVLHFFLFSFFFKLNGASFYERYSELFRDGRVPLCRAANGTKLFQSGEWKGLWETRIPTKLFSGH
jgi:hypothetical protein